MGPTTTSQPLVLNEASDTQSNRVTLPSQIRFVTLVFTPCLAHQGVHKAGRVRAERRRAGWL